MESWALVVATAVAEGAASRGDPVITYVLPLRCEACAAGEHDELARYLRWLATSALVILADGSTWRSYTRHGRTFRDDVAHLPIDEDVERFTNGKVAGVTTGVRAAATDRVIIADDDVRYAGPALEAVARALDEADLVIPQNVFPSGTQPWHARWDGARSLLNRATAFDPPGTLGLRRSAFLAAGGYDGDVLFENLELIRTIAASGGRIVVRRDIAVERLAPSSRRFFEQRVRQAYDEFARPARLVAFLAIGPATAWLTRRTRWTPIAVAAIAIAVAEVGRRRDGGREMFAPSTSLMAPLWLTERAVTSWLALGSRLLRGGVPYRGRVLTRSATPTRRLRARRGMAPLHVSRHTAASSGNGHIGTAARSHAGS
jgi:hypothetical protein